MLIVKILGILDIMTAVVIYTNSSYLFLTFPLFLVHFIKGLTSLAADWIGKFYGVVDIIASFIIMFSINLPVAIEALLIIVLIFKGFTSLL